MATGCPPLAQTIVGSGSLGWQMFSLKLEQPRGPRECLCLTTLFTITGSPEVIVLQPSFRCKQWAFTWEV